MALNEDINNLPDAVTAGQTGRLARTGTVYQALKAFLTKFDTKLTIPSPLPSAGKDLGLLLSDLGLRTAGALIWSQQNSFNKLIILGEAIRYVTANRTAAVTLSGTSANYEFCDATTAAYAITLSGATTAGQMFHIQKTDASANAVTVTAAAGQTIAGAATYPLAAKGKRVTIVSDGSTDWKIVESN